MSHQGIDANQHTGNGSVVLYSIMAAGAAGLAGAVLIGRPGKQERAQDHIDQKVAELKSGVDRSSEQLTKAVEGLNFDREATTRKAKKQLTKLQKSSSKALDEAIKAANSRVAELEKHGMSLQVREQAKGLASNGSDKVASFSAMLMEQVTSALEEARARAAETSGKTAEAASETAVKVESKAREIASQATAEASEAAEDASRQAHDLKARGAELAAVGTAFVSDALRKSPEVLDRVGKAADDARHHAPELKESLSGIVGAMAELGNDVVTKAKEQAPEIADTLATTLASRSSDLREQAKPLIADAGAAVAGVADQVLVSAKDAGSHVKPGIQAQVGTLGDKVSSGTTVIGEQSKHAASAAGKGARETGAVVMWTAAGATIVYAALLDDRQRQRLKDSAQRVWSEMREVLADMRGYDEEFK